MAIKQVRILLNIRQLNEYCPELADYSSTSKTGGLWEAPQQNHLNQKVLQELMQILNAYTKEIPATVPKGIIDESKKATLAQQLEEQFKKLQEQQKAYDAKVAEMKKVQDEMLKKQLETLKQKPAEKAPAPSVDTKTITEMYEKLYKKHLMKEKYNDSWYYNDKKYSKKNDDWDW